MSQATVFCPQCGASNDSNNRFCSECGTSLPGARPAEEAPKKKRKPATTACIIIAVVLVCLCIGVVLIGWFYGDQIIRLLQPYLPFLNQFIGP
jgi:uncharacterized membrane protein YvbJ